MKDIAFFFNPRSIAIIGASPTPGKISHEVMENLRHTGYTGRVYPVNPKYDSIDGIECFGSAVDIDGDVDVAVVCVPASGVMGVMEDLAAKGVKGAIIVSAGFRETGPEGKKLEEALANIATKTGIRIMGPNCMGVFDNVSKLDTFFILRERIKRPGPGTLSILSQSGSFAGTIMDTLAAEGVGVARVVSYGNRVDVGESDCLEFLAKDASTGAVGIYMESVDDGRRFVEAAARCARVKPVFIVKIGRHEGGASAARSHTGAIAGRYEIYRAAFRKAGLIEVRGYDEFLDASKILSSGLGGGGGGGGKKVLIITDGGGLGASVADACGDEGLDVSGPSRKVRERLKERLPPFCGFENPLDLTGSVRDDDYTMVLKEAMAEYDAAIVLALWGPPGLTDGLVEGLKEVSRGLDKPVIICSPGGEYTRKKSKLFEEAGLPVFSSPEGAARAAAILARR